MAQTYSSIKEAGTSSSRNLLWNPANTLVYADVTQGWLLKNV